MLADQLTIYEQSRVLTAEGDLLTTELGSVQAEHIVFACHFPFVNFPGMYFARMHQERSYVLALQGAPPVDGMFLGVGRDTFSLRTYGELLLLGGGGHRTGENTEGGRYDLLRRKAGSGSPRARRPPTGLPRTAYRLTMCPISAPTLPAIPAGMWPLGSRSGA